MSAQAIDEAALADCIRATLQQFLPDHPDLEYAEVGITVNGIGVEVAVAAPGSAAPQDYIADALAGFKSDPADSDFQRGYHAALETVAREAFGMRRDSRP